jgi:hypothetical protein
MIQATWHSDDLGLVVNGVFDVVFAFARALEQRGLLDRREIAGLLTEAKAQIEAQQGPSVRTILCDLMIQAFAMPQVGEDARSRLRVLDGGTDRPG